MPSGPFDGPRPFAGASLNISFVFPRGVGATDLELEQRLRRNGFSRADVQLEEAGTDSRVRVVVTTNEERMTHNAIMRIIGQVKRESDRSIPDDRIEVFCT